MSPDVDGAAVKVGQLFVDDNHRTGTGKRHKNKKPEQPHYSAKKVTTPSGTSENATADVDVVKENIVKENVIKENVVKENIIKENVIKENIVKESVVVGKPPQQPAKPATGADDVKSEGGGSNTGTARRRAKNKQRSAAAEKAVSPASKERQVQ
jgi:hypothetical protein